MEMEEPAEVVEHFFGVYLLYCTNPMYRGRTYIGYTVDPRRRIKQHNAGKKFGGAWRTSDKGPWNMVLIVHGFPNSTSALRFEWAWQHPSSSRRLRHVPKKKSAGQSVFQYRLAVLSEMLNVGPWRRLPLTVRWLDYEFSVAHRADVSPPMHMPISYGKVASESLRRRRDASEDAVEEAESEDTRITCSLCDTRVKMEDGATCVKFNCRSVVHLICLAGRFAKDRMLLPVEGDCPACGTNILWGDLIRKKIGCHLRSETTYAPEDSSDESDASSAR